MHIVVAASCGTHAPPALAAFHADAPPPPPPPPTACLCAQNHLPLLDVRSLEHLARFHRDAMLQSGAHALPHLEEEYKLFQEVVAACRA